MVPILVVEDDPHDAMLVQKGLEGAGFRQSYVVPSGEAALQWLARDECQLILFEYNLPGMNGLQLMDKVRGRESRVPVPFIVTTRNREAKVAVSLMQAGVADYIFKDDYFTSNLVRAVQAALRKTVSVEERQHLALLESGRSKLQVAQAEAGWLLQMFRSRLGFPAAAAEQGEQVGVWSEVVDAFRGYIETSLRTFPDVITRTEDSLIRMLIDRGLSPRDVVMLYSLALMALKNDAAEEQTPVRVNPGVFLSRILTRMIDEYQRWASMSALENAA
ncbi:MAG TPA: response regulator [Dehalococcoidia bacterium]|jgi:DNA-binding response OmpR family regulator